MYLYTLCSLYACKIRNAIANTPYLLGTQGQLPVARADELVGRVVAILEVHRVQSHYIRILSSGPLAPFVFVILWLIGRYEIGPKTDAKTRPSARAAGVRLTQRNAVEGKANGKGEWPNGVGL